jgi:drug/metabolite transporter (DMT)-like permease
MASATSSRPTYSASGSRRAAFGALVLANVLWAGSYTAGKVALAELPPVELNALRFTLAALLLAPVLIRYRKQIPRDRRMLFILLQLSLLGFVLNKALEYIGLSLSTASDVALLIATESLFTGLLSWIFLRERVTRTGVAALAVGLLGVYLIVERGLVPNLGEGNTTRIVGDVLVVVWRLAIPSAARRRSRRCRRCSLQR